MDRFGFSNRETTYLVWVSDFGFFGLLGQFQLQNVPSSVFSLKCKLKRTMKTDFHKHCSNVFDLFMLGYRFLFKCYFVGRYIKMGIYTCSGFELATVCLPYSTNTS